MCTVSIPTGLQFEDIRNILTQFCHGSYEISLGGVEEINGIMRKILVFNFTDEDDCDRIRQVFGINHCQDLTHAG